MRWNDQTRIDDLTERLRTSLGLFTSDHDRGVSPVIGVVLMVAITVILAAVIGAFVLGMGGEQTESPQASFDIDIEDGSVTIAHKGGDALKPATLDIVIGGDSREDALSSPGDDETFTAGEEIYSGSAESGAEITVIWHSPSGRSTVLSQTSVP